MNIRKAGLREGFDYVCLIARTNTLFVFGELLKPVSATNSTLVKPTSFNMARKSFPGIAPPSHLNQLSTIDFVSFGGSLIKT